MNTAFFAIDASFLVVGLAAIATGNDVAWSTFFALGAVFLALGIVFLALAFAPDRGSTDASE